MLDAFLNPVYKPAETFNGSGNKTKVREYGLELNKETGDTSVVIQGEYDLQSEIDSAYESSGLYGMMELIKRGQAVPRDFYDDGKSGGDVSGLPDNVNDAYRETLKKSENAGSVVDGLGLDRDKLKSGDFDTIIKERISQILNEQVAAAKKEGEGK